MIFRRHKFKIEELIKEYIEYLKKKVKGPAKVI